MRTWVYLIAAALLFGAGIITAVHFKDAEIAHLKAEHQAHFAHAQTVAARRLSELERKKENALEQYAQENLKLRMDADAARAAVERLRRAARAHTAATSAPHSSAAAADDRSAHVAELLADCADAYRSMAEIADQHAADARLVRGAWPRAGE